MRVDGFPGGHPNLNSGHPCLLENIVGGVLGIKMHLTSFGPKEVKNETPKNIEQLSNVRKVADVVALNIGKVFLSFNN